MDDRDKASRVRHLRLIALGLTALTTPALAWADGRALSFDFEKSQNYGRIIASWADSNDDAPKITARMTGPVLILRFDEPVSFDPEELQDGLPDYIAVARLADDGLEARIALAREYRIHQSYSYDLTGIDLVSPLFPSDPADIVSPLAAQRQREAEQAAAAAEAARLAALPPALDVDLRASEAGSFSTLTFYWPEDISYTTRDLADAIEIKFSRRGNADLAHARIEPPEGMRTIEAVNTDENWVVTIGLEEGYWASPLKVDSAVLVRFRPGEKPVDANVEEVVLPAALQALADELPEEKIEPPSRKPYPESPLDKVEEHSPEEASEGPVELVHAPQAHEEEPEPEVKLAPITQRRLWNEALDRTGMAHVTAVPTSNGMNLDIAFQSEIPAAIFRRHGAVWIAFPASGEFDISKDAQKAGHRIDQIRSEEGMALRIFMPDDQLISIKQSGRLWSVAIGGKGDLANVRLKPVRTASSGGSGILVNVPDVGTVFDIEDPEVGERFTIVPVMRHTTSLDRSLRFVEASLPVTTQGLVIVPHTDDLKVIQRGEQVLISRDSGLAISNWGVDTELRAEHGLSPGFLDFAIWRRGDEADFWDNHSRLDRAAALADEAEWSGQSALFDLARFYLSWELGPEAYGPLTLIADGDPLMAEDAQWLALKAAADIMVGRYSEALELLDRSNVRSDASVAAWRGLAFAELGDWRKAREAFNVAEPMIDAFDPIWAGRFHAAAARANIRMGDGAEAERHAMAARRSGDDTAMGQAALTLGELALASDRKQDAASTFTKLLDHKDANVRVRAELAGILLARETGKMSALDASDRLDTLRFRWRGDALELEIVSALVDNLFELGHFREALTLAQSTTMQFPDMPGSRDLRIRMMDQFEDLFLHGRADDMDPILALALFYEFKDLTPIGPDGDRMIRKLANRLVAFDLLDPATELLAHQVENRNIVGAGKAKIAADLAAIYLLDERPEEALRTIAATRQTGLDDELRLERRLLEAAAHMELKRYGHAIELLDGLTDQRALDLLAEVHWRSRTWGAAGRALQGTLPSAGTMLTSQQAQTALRSAVAYRLDGDYEGLASLRKGYLTVMSTTPYAESFDLLTGTNEVSSVKLTDTIRTLADTSSADAFIKSLKERFGDAGGMK